MPVPAGELPKNELPADLRDLTYEKVESGNHNHVYISHDPVPEIDCHTGVVIKVAREHSVGPPYLNTRSVLGREAAGVALLGAALNDDVLAPFQFPRMIAVGRHNRWAAFSRVAEEVLSLETVADLSHDEQTLWGQKIGQIATRLSHVNVEVFQDAVDEQHGPCQFNREQYLLASLGHEDRLRAMGYPQVSEVLRQLGTDYGRWHEQGLFQPDGVVHGDLHLGNQAFVLNGDGQHILNGLFDFGNIQLARIEQELYSLLYFSETAARAALETYVTETKKPALFDIVRFWLRAQTVVTTVPKILDGEVTPVTVGYMQRVYPEPMYDWEAELIGR